MSHLIINECRKCRDVFENWNDQTATTQGNLINPLNERKFLLMNALLPLLSKRQDRFLQILWR